MTRDELIETMARAIYNDRNGFGCRKFGLIGIAHQKPYRADAIAVLASIEAQGMAIVRQDAIDWLMGTEGEFERPVTAKGNFWWRPEFRKRAMIEPGRI